MDPPATRYRVIEKDGRLIVVDKGVPVTPSIGPPPPARPGRPSPAPVGAGDPRALDRFGRLLLTAVTREWDSQGRAVIAWRWEQNGVKKSWDAVLDEGQQRRLGRALVAIATAPLMFVLTILSGGLLLLPAFVVGVPALIYGMIGIRRIQKETGDTQRVA